MSNCVEFEIDINPRSHSGENNCHHEERVAYECLPPRIKKVETVQEVQPIVELVPKVTVRRWNEIVPREQIIRWNEVIPREEIIRTVEVKKTHKCLPPITHTVERVERIERRSSAKASDQTVLSRLAQPHLTEPRLTAPNLTGPHLTPTHLTQSQIDAVQSPLPTQSIKSVRGSPAPSPAPTPAPSLAPTPAPTPFKVLTPLTTEPLTPTRTQSSVHTVQVAQSPAHSRTASNLTVKEYILE